MPALIDLASKLKKQDFAELPIIDLTDAKSTSVDRRKEVADNIRDACLNAGFFFVKNHSVPQETVDSAFKVAESFFSQSTNVKESVDVQKSNNFRGYIKLLSENNDPTREGEVHEAFNLGLDPSLGLSSPPKPKAEEGPVSQYDNQWPDTKDWEGAEAFRAVTLDYYKALLSLGQSLFPLFALALGLDEHFFDDKTKHLAAIMRMLHYPGTPLEQHKEENPGIGAHTDFECFTILAQGGVSGLQVQNHNGDWINAPYIPGTFVINIGDQFARWTNDIFVSTRHRVLPPTETRYSIPFFFGCDHDVPLIAPDTCVSEERPMKYEVITAGEYVRMRLEQTYNSRREKKEDI